VAEPGWHPDPYGSGGLRYWSGTAWTEHVAAWVPQRPAPVSFRQAVRLGFRRFATLEGRASPAEYWWWYLFYVICFLPWIVIAMVGFLLSLRADGSFGPTVWVALGAYVVMILVSLALLVPTVCVGVRRLHDTDRSGWWELLQLVPFGNLVLLVFHVLPGMPGPNQYGPVPGHAA
jgi:uncharacterized membrane protein YhaH (DUF805 family)